ncbi:MAG TPA: COX15/CtaA family protein [Pseudonocardia sp.]|uniref:COX15/CtaA family protein n=1 Tax=Pseudonocardia sp. TaxID=60912 RepID=UPI002F3F7975
MLLDRLPTTPPALMRALGIAAVVAQAGIAVTGSVVRVTGSGLGCPAWPSCFSGSLVPDPRYNVAPLHQWVEFGNRLLGVLVTVVTIACVLAALRARPRRRLVRLSVAVLAGVLAQAVLGGITVLTGLIWWTVAAHFLVSMILVWMAVLLSRATAAPEAPACPVLPRAGQALLALCVLVLAGLLVAGTLVTSAGPHAGDAKTPRLDLPVSSLAQLHADLLIGFLGLLAGLGFLLRVVGVPPSVHRRYWVLVAVVVAQGVLGAAQYALGVPEVLVSLHVLGACLVTAAAAGLWAVTRCAPVAPPQSRRARQQPAPAELSTG